MDYVSLGYALIAAAVLVYLSRVWQGERRADREVAMVRETNLMSFASNTTIGFIQRLTMLEERIMMLKGMHPHHVDPKTFMPGGMSREVYDMAQAAPAAPVEIEGEDAEHRRRLEADHKEWLDMAKQPEASDPFDEIRMGAEKAT